MRKMLYIFLIFLVKLSLAQTPNVNIPHTSHFKFNEWRAHVDTVKAGDTTTTSPTNVGTNGNWIKTDSILYSLSSHDSLIQISYTLGSGGWFGNGHNGAIGIVADTTLSSDLVATTLRIDAGVHVKTAGYRIFFDSLFLNATATITDTGANGNDGVAGGNGICPSTAGSGGATAGAALTAKADGYLGRDAASAVSLNGAGSVGTQSGNTSNGNQGLAQTGLVGSAGVAGGAGGGTTGHTAGTGGPAGATTVLPVTAGDVFNFLALYQDRAFSNTPAVLMYRPAGFSGGGAGGAGDNGAGSAYGQGGGGGGGAAPGGVVWMFGRVWTGSGTITVKGGKGGNGGKGGDSGGGGCAASCGAGGGGGGGGGTGGIIVAGYHQLASTITFVVTGGNGGTHGNAGSGSCSPQNGVDGSNGNTGKLCKISM